MITAKPTGIAPSWYTPEQGEDEEKTRFKLRPLETPEMESIMCMTEHGTAEYHPKNNEKILRLGLVGWENFSLPDASELKFTYINFKSIPLGLRSELVAEILTRSRLTEDEAKN